MTQAEPIKEKNTRYELAPSGAMLWKGAVQQTPLVSIHRRNGQILVGTTRCDLVKELFTNKLQRLLLKFWRPFAEPVGCKVLVRSSKDFVFIPYTDIHSVFCYLPRNVEGGSLGDAWDRESCNCVGAYVELADGAISFTDFQEKSQTIYQFPPL